MADDGLDEDLFADLYEDNNDEPPPSQAAAKAEPVVNEVPSVKPEAIAAEPQVHQAPAIAASSLFGGDPVRADNDNGAQWNMKSEENGDAEDKSWNGQSREPIGIKEDGKMFIGGLNWSTTDESLREYFEQFGEVLECTVMRDPSGQSRGFGFLRFKDPKVVNIVQVKEHRLDDKIVRTHNATSLRAAPRGQRIYCSHQEQTNIYQIDPKRAIPRDEQEKTSKIFVGGVSSECTDRDFREFFMQFGRVIDATLMMDKQTGRPRGFGFVTFDGAEAAERALSQPLAIHGKMIEVKPAEPRNAHERGAGGGGGGRGGRFGRGEDGGRNNDNRPNQQPHGSMMMGDMSQTQFAQNLHNMKMLFEQTRAYWAQNIANQQAQMQQMAGANGQMNPAQMQQMMMMQQMQQQQQQQMQMQEQQYQGQQHQGQPQAQSPSGTPGPQSPSSDQNMNNMNPQMMNQMQQQQMMAMQQGGGQGLNDGSGFNGQVPAGPRNATDQNLFEQQKFEQQMQMQRMQQNQQYAQAYSGGGQGAWEGMYDDVPPPNQGGGQGGNFRGRGSFGPGGRRGRGGGEGPAQHTSNAPANAPTGPKNAGRPFSNYRGGGRGGRAGWKPY